MPHLLFLIFLFLLGSCIGSFLNVVIWRLPRGQSLSNPPSHCPACGLQLKWYDNLPIVGWIKLGGKCRFCKAAISSRYPIVETVTAVMFVLYYILFYMMPPGLHLGPCARMTMPGSDYVREHFARQMVEDWPIFLLCLYLLSALLAASLIDAELFIIPTAIVWGWGGIAVVSLLVHTLADAPSLPGALNAGPVGAAVGAGGGLGLALSMLLLRLGVLPLSFAEGGPLLEVEKAAHEREVEVALRAGGSEPEAPPEYTPKQVRAEMRKEMLFLLPPLLGAFICLWLTWQGGLFHRQWEHAVQIRWVSALLGSVLGGLIGGFVVWLTRILGTLGFGREAMGMGDVDLMAGIGAALGAGPATIAFFLAPFFGIVVAIYMLLTGKRRELPYGPYLSLATAFVMVCYCPIASYLTPGLMGLAGLVRLVVWGKA